MKILYIIHQYLPNFHAGAENYTHSLAHAMADLGHDVFVVATEPLSKNDYHIEEYKEGNVNVIKIHKNVSVITGLEDTYTDFRYEEAFKGIFEKINPEFVHVQHLLYTSVGIIDFIKKRNIPIVYTLHDSWLECLRIAKLDYKNEICTGWSPEKCATCYNHSKLYIGNKKTAGAIRKILNVFLKSEILLRFLESIKKTIIDLRPKNSKDRYFIEKRYDSLHGIVDLVDLFISPSQFLLDSYVKWEIPKNKIILSRNGMEIFDQKEKMQKNGNASIVFAFTSFIRKEKGVDVLLDAFELLHEENLDAKLVMYGRYDRNSSYGADFVKRVAKLKNVEYRGGFDNKKINDILSEVDYLVLPALWLENAPLVIEEAYLNKIPCIVSNIGGMAERVDDGVNGLHFKVGNAQDLAEKIRYLLKNPQLREEFVKNIPHVKTIKENAKEIEEIYIGYRSL